MMIKKTLNEGLRRKQEQSVKKTEAKLITALKKQNKNIKVNVSQLSRDSGISRTQIINKYNYLYEGRENESAKVQVIKLELDEQKRKNIVLIKKNTELINKNKQLSDKLVELNVIIDALKKRMKTDSK